MSNLQPEKFERLVREHGEFLRALAQKLTHDSNVAADVVQETWMAVWLRKEAAPRSWRAWLATVARNVSASESR